MQGDEESEAGEGRTVYRRNKSCKAYTLPSELSPLSSSPTQACAFDHADGSVRIALCEAFAVAAGEDVLLDP